MLKKGTEGKKLSVAYVRDFHIHRVSGDGSVGIQIARIRNQLRSEQNALIGFVADVGSGRQIIPEDSRCGSRACRLFSVGKW